MRIYIGGLGLCGDGYPNAARTVALLRQQSDLEVVDCGRWLPEDLHLWKLARMPRARALRWLLVLAFGNLRSLLRICARERSAPGLVYVPYPGVFFLFWLSLLPHGWRPTCIVDSYISIWDSMFRDRAAGKSQGLLASLLKKIEKRALGAATMVLVDTDANRDIFIAEFALDPAKVRSIPLAIDEDRFLAVARSADTRDARRIRILFVGTMIPLHGISLVLDAIEELADDTRLEFRLIGDGQQSDRVSAFIAANPAVRVTWLREWCPLDRIAQEISQADICLGVFGGNGKAARVLPFKLYMYLSCGRAIVSQSLLSTPEGAPAPPIEAVASACAEDLADSIRGLANDPARREHLGREAAAYYGQWLANSRVAADWREMLGRLAAPIT